MQRSCDAQITEMIPSSREIQLQATKHEEKLAPNNGTSKLGTSTKTTSQSSSRQWSAFRNPRIVRVSRSFEGKDRHSKVCTVRGLRDRRIRLSVPTAIQLYDLQERLGLSQPSKVIDWLIDSTKEDIDKLPPLQLPQGSFGQFLQQAITGNDNIDQIADPNFSTSNLPLLFDGNLGLFSSKNSGKNVNVNGRLQNSELVGERSKYWDYLDAASKGRSMEVERNIELNQAEKSRYMQEMIYNQHGHHFQGLRDYNNNNHVSAHNFFPVASDHSPIYNPYNQSWDPTSTLTLNHQLGSRGITSSHQPRNDQNHSNLSFASSSSTLSDLPPAGQQLFFCPPSAPALFPVTTYPQYSTVSLEGGSKTNQQLFPFVQSQYGSKHSR